MGKEFLSMQELARRYGVSRRAIYDWINHSRFPAGIRLGGTRRWSLSEIEAFEENSKKGGK